MHDKNWRVEIGSVQRPRLLRCHVMRTLLLLLACWGPLATAGCSDVWLANLEDGEWEMLFASVYPKYWDGDTGWERFGEPGDPNYSALDGRHRFARQGTYAYKLEIGLQGSWQGSEADFYNVWAQDHDPLTETTDGSDYRYIDGTEPVTCGGFNGLHHRHYEQASASGVRHARTSDVDTGDSLACWTMQVVPVEHYRDAGGYLQGYEGILGEHAWQVLWAQ